MSKRISIKSDINWYQNPNKPSSMLVTFEIVNSSVPTRSYVVSHGVNAKKRKISTKNTIKCCFRFHSQSTVDRLILRIADISYENFMYHSPFEQSINSANIADR